MCEVFVRIQKMYFCWFFGLRLICHMLLILVITGHFSQDHYMVLAFWEECYSIVGSFVARVLPWILYDNLILCTTKVLFASTITCSIALELALQCKNYWKNNLYLAYKTLGVVFGGLVTSPLYVFPSMRLKSPTEADYLGIFSIMFWTLTLVGVVKYVCIALKADDQGEGGTFAVYSLLCRHLNIGQLSSYGNSNTASSLSSYRLAENKSTRLGKFLQKNVVARRVLLFISMLGMCMLIGDGILTPAISVLSAIQGIRAPFPSVTKSEVEALSVVIVIVLFLLQRYGTSRVSFLFSPIMGIWTLTTPVVGIYQILMHYPGIFKALSPHYIVMFFLRNGKEGWFLLNGTILCITGSEAMFADLGHFNRPSIQIAFLFGIYPSLVLTYAGQVAYLIKNPEDFVDGFYKFLPAVVYWPMFMVATLSAVVASQSLISATFSLVKQAVTLDYFPRLKVVHTSKTREGEVYSPEVNYILMILCVSVILIFGDGQEIGNAFGVVVNMVMLITSILLTIVMVIVWQTPAPLIILFCLTFVLLEGVYLSAVLTKIPEGGWIPFAIALILVVIMYVWYHGRQKKLEYELKHKIEIQDLPDLLLSNGVKRVPGLCFFYTKIQNEGLTPILRHYIKNMRSLHRITIFTTLEYRLVPKVETNEQVIIRPLGVKGLYLCVIQYGYCDSLRLDGGSLLVNQVLSTLQASLKACNTTDMHGDTNTDMEEEIVWLEEAKSADAVHVRGKIRFYVEGKKSRRRFDRLMLGLYNVLHSNCRSALPALGVPLHQTVEVGMLCQA